MLSGYCIDIGDRTREHFYILLPATRIHSPSTTTAYPILELGMGALKKIGSFFFLRLLVWKIG